MNKPKVFFDGSCPLCRKEIGHYQRLDQRQQIDWLDLHSAEEQLTAHQITHKAAMQRLHAIDQHSQIQSGVAAFMLIWDNLPRYHYLAKLIRVLRLENLLEKAYCRFALWRFNRRCSVD